MFPPAARIFSAAARLKACTRTVSGRVISPFPKILMPAFASRTTRVSSSSSGVTTVLGSKRFSFSTLTVAYSRLKVALVKPRLGRRRCSGVWPPSKPGPLPPPARAPWPFWPRPDVLPRPEPMPRPTRLAFRRAPAGGRNSCSFISDFLHFDQVAHLEDHPANGGIVLVHHGVVETPQSQRANRVLLVLLTTDRASFPRDLQLPGHHQSPLTHDLLDGLAAQRGDLLRRAHLPQRLERGPHHVGGVVGAQRLGQHVAHARPGPLALTPVPGVAGFNHTLAPLERVGISCGLVGPTCGPSIMFLLALSTAFRIALATSRDVPSPAPTFPAPSPTSTCAGNL